jgi:hypothetical protein
MPRPDGVSTDILVYSTECRSRPGSVPSSTRAFPRAPGVCDTDRDASPRIAPQRDTAHSNATPMSDLAIANDGTGFDLVLVDGDLVFGFDDEAAEVAQRVIYRLMTWLGESPYDRLAGVPYLDGVFNDFEPVPGIVALLIQVVLDTEGVDEITDDPLFELEDRVLTITATIRVGAELVPISLPVTGTL